MDTLGISYIHKVHPRSRSIKIHIEANGDVVVVTPPRFPTYRIPSYVEQARDWIIRTKQKVLVQQKQRERDTILFFGQEYTVVVGDRMDGSIRMGEASITIHPLSGLKRDSQMLLDRWYQQKAKEYIVERVYELAKVMNQHFEKLRFGHQKTCWGSCSSNRTLTFNLHLVHAPKEVIDYVLIHELAHLKHLNHSNSFWDFVAHFDPDYPLHRGWLKRHGNSAE